VQAITHYTARRALDARRRASREHSLAIEPRAPHRPEETLERLLVHQILERLSAGCRALITEYFLEQCSYEEIAARLAVPVGTVKSRLFRCLEAAHRASGPAGALAGERARNRQPRVDNTSPERDP
jgi:RNA polymerase sigma factor (sigma-70 family)